MICSIVSLWIDLRNSDPEKNKGNCQINQLFMINNNILHIFDQIKVKRVHCELYIEITLIEIKNDSSLIHKMCGQLYT